MPVAFAVRRTPAQGSAGWDLLVRQMSRQGRQALKQNRARSTTVGADKKKRAEKPFFLNGAPDRSRTCDLRLRRATLYPTELRALNFFLS